MNATKSRIFSDENCVVVEALPAGPSQHICHGKGTAAIFVALTGQQGSRKSLALWPILFSTKGQFANLKKGF